MGGDPACVASFARSPSVCTRRCTGPGGTRITWSARRSASCSYVSPGVSSMGFVWISPGVPGYTGIPLKSWSNAAPEAMPEPSAFARRDLRTAWFPTVCCKCRMDSTRRLAAEAAVLDLVGLNDACRGDRFSLCKSAQDLPLPATSSIARAYRYYTRKSSSSEPFRSRGVTHIVPVLHTPRTALPAAEGAYGVELAAGQRP